MPERLFAPSWPLFLHLLPCRTAHWLRAFITVYSPSMITPMATAVSSTAVAPNSSFLLNQCNQALRAQCPKHGGSCRSWRAPGQSAGNQLTGKRIIRMFPWQWKACLGWRCTPQPCCKESREAFTVASAYQSWKDEKCSFRMAFVRNKDRISFSFSK